MSESSSSGGSSRGAADLEKKVKQLKSELLQKKSEAEKLRQTLKLKEKTKLKEKEEFLKKKISSYDALIGKIKTALDTEQEQLQAISNKNININKKSNKKEVFIFYKQITGNRYGSWDLVILMGLDNLN